MAEARGYYDKRSNTDVRAMLKELGADPDRTLIGRADLREVSRVLRAIPSLQFPIDSAGELLNQVEGGGRLDVAGVSVEPRRMIKYVPPFYFPITSLENFIEKLGELVRVNRPHPRIDRAIAEEQFRRIQDELSDIEFPIDSADRLLELLPFSDYEIDGRKLDLRTVVPKLPPDYFPLRSADDFYAMVRELLRSRPLIVSD